MCPPDDSRSSGFRTTSSTLNGPASFAFSRSPTIGAVPATGSRESDYVSPARDRASQPGAPLERYAPWPPPARG